MIDEQELTAQEEQPFVIQERVLHRLPDADVWQIQGQVVAWFDADGVEWTQARCRAILDADVTEDFHSDVYRLIRAGDPGGQSLYETKEWPIRNMTVAYATEQNEKALLTRMKMNFAQEQSVNDMLPILTELRAKAVQRIKEYQRQAVRDAQENVLKAERANALKLVLGGLLEADDATRQAFREALANES